MFRLRAFTSNLFTSLAIVALMGQPFLTGWCHCAKSVWQKSDAPTASCCDHVRDGAALVQCNSNAVCYCTHCGTLKQTLAQTVPIDDVQRVRPEQVSMAIATVNLGGLRAPCDSFMADAPTPFTSAAENCVALCRLLL